MATQRQYPSIFSQKACHTPSTRKRTLPYFHPQSGTLLVMKSSLIPTFLFLLCLVGCEKMADVGSPQEYDADGLSFSYPGNWSISVEKLGQGEDKTKVINLESPGDAIVIVCLYDFEEISRFGNSPRISSRTWICRNPPRKARQVRFLPNNQTRQFATHQGIEESTKV